MVLYLNSKNSFTQNSHNRSSQKQKSNIFKNIENSFNDLKNNIQKIYNNISLTYMVNRKQDTQERASQNITNNTETNTAIFVPLNPRQ